MMQKYFQIGKQYLTKKLQQLDQSPKTTDYLNDQIPSRLKQSLQIIQQGNIDIEDTQPYENYFKSYPNHHLSHFLLDKYNMMVEAEAEPGKYVLPMADVHVPEFDAKLETNALLFREAIEEYDQGYFKNDQPIICLSVVNFHHKRGTEVEYRYPQTKTVADIQPMIVHHAMPDSSHHKGQDYNYFNFEAQYKGKKRMLFGVSYFKQIKLTQQMKKQNSELTRSYLQKAIAILSTVPLFAYLKLKLCITTKVFFQKFTQYDIIQQAYKQLNKHFIDYWPNMPISDLNYGTDLKRIIGLFQIQNFYQIWKAVLYEKRIVVFAHSSSSVSSFILSLMSLFPGLNTFGIYSKPIAKYMQSLRQLALPLRSFSSQNFLLISFHIQDFWQIEKFKKSSKGHFLIGTTNRLLKQNNDYGIQLLVNLQNCSIQKRSSRRPWQAISKKQKTFLNQLKQMVQVQNSSAFGGSQDCIRNHFHNFLKSALVQLISSIKAFQQFCVQAKTYQKKLEQQAIRQQKSDEIIFQPVNLKNQAPLFPERTKKIIFPQLLLNKSFAYFRQFKNQKLPQIVKGKILPSLYISNYDYLLRLNESEFISYNWIDKKLSFGKGLSLKNYSGKQIRFKTSKNEQGADLVKSVFIGMVANGKFNKNGFYVDQFEQYEGQYQNGFKQGYGKLITSSEKYLGNFHGGLYEGQGQLVVNNDIYVGEFKRGVKDGFGSMQGTMNFQGIWQDGVPKIQPPKQQQTKAVQGLATEPPNQSNQQQVDTNTL